MANLTALLIAKFTLRVYALSFSFLCISQLSNGSESEKNIAAAPNISTPKALKAAIQKKLIFRTESVAFSLFRSHPRLADTAHIYMKTRRHNELLSHREQKQKRSLLKRRRQRRRRRAYTHLYKYTHIIFRTHCNIEGITQIKEVFACLPNNLHRNSDHFAGRVQKNFTSETEVL